MKKNQKVLKKMGIQTRNASKNKKSYIYDDEDEYIYPSTSFRGKQISDPSGRYGSFKTDKPVKIIAHCTVAKKNIGTKKLIEVHPRIFYKI